MFRYVQINIFIQDMHIFQAFQDMHIFIGLAAEWIQEPVVMEPDCMVAIQYLKEVKVLKPVCLSIIQEASHEASRLPGFELNHVKRDRNSVAKDLAQMAKCLNHSAVWWGCYPACTEQLIALDCNISMSNQ